MFHIEEAKTDLLKAATHLAQKITSSEGQAEAFSQIISSYLEQNQIDIAFQLAKQIIDPFTKDQIMLQISEKCAQIGEDELAFELVEQIEDESLHLQAFEKIAFQKIVSGQIEKAIQIAGKLSHPDNIYSELCSYFARQNKAQEAQEIADRISFPTTKALALQDASSIFVENIQKEKAIEFLEKALEVTFGIDYKIDEIKLLISIAESFIKIQMTDKAIEILGIARKEAGKIDDPDREHFLSLISIAFLESGNIELADETLDFVTDKTLIASTLVGFSDFFLKNGEKNEALEALDEALQILKSQSEYEIQSTRMFDQTLISIATRLADPVEVERAILATEMIKSTQEKITALQEIACILAFKQEDELAEQIAKMISKENNRSEAFIRLSSTKLFLNQKEKALYFLDIAVEYIDFIPQAFLQVKIHNEAAQRFFDCDNREEGEKMAREALQKSLKIKDEVLKITCIVTTDRTYKQNSIKLSEEEVNLLYESLIRSEMSI